MKVANLCNKQEYYKKQLRLQLHTRFYAFTELLVCFLRVSQFTLKNLEFIRYPI